jgi:hypothetical protein
MSGGGTKLFAAIGVTYPVGSTLTCTNGTKTLTAKTTSGQWVFAVPEAGTWTVTSGTKSKSVSITKEGQFETVNLAQEYLFKENEGVVSEWDALLGGYSQAAVTAQKMTLFGGDAVYNSSSAAVTTNNAVNLDGFTKLIFDMQTDMVANQGAYAWVGVSAKKFTRGPESSTISKSNSAAYTELSATNRDRVVVDISDLSGNYYVFAASDGMKIETTVYNVWLE